MSLRRICEIVVDLCLKVMFWSLLGLGLGLHLMSPWSNEWQTPSNLAVYETVGFHLIRNKNKVLALRIFNYYRPNLDDKYCVDACRRYDGEQLNSRGITTGRVLCVWKILTHSNTNFLRPTFPHRRKNILAPNATNELAWSERWISVMPPKYQAFSPLIGKKSSANTEGFFSQSRDSRLGLWNMLLYIWRTPKGYHLKAKKLLDLTVYITQQVTYAPLCQLFPSRRVSLPS